MKLLITGGCGFLGSNLAATALDKQFDLCLFDNLSRLGSFDNLQWLKGLGSFSFYHGDIRNRNDIEQCVRAFRPEVIFHLAGQVAMTSSIKDPRQDFEINAMGSLHLLEAVREYAKECIVLYSSTNKVYGDLEGYRYIEDDKRFLCVDAPNGFDESTPVQFHSPYGCSKGCADQYLQDYARLFDLKTVVFRHSSMYGGRQYASFDQGWVGWFCQMAVETKQNKRMEPFTISGTGKQVRDVLHVKDLCSLYFNTLDHIEVAQGQVFNIGGGVQNSLSLLELFDLLESLINQALHYCCIEARKSDQRVFVANIGKAQQYLQWSPQISATMGITEMLEWVESIRV